MHQAANAWSLPTWPVTLKTCARSGQYECPFELHLPDGRVSGRADIILDGRPAAQVPWQLWTTRSPPDRTREDRYQHQLQVYTAAGRGEGLNVEAAYLHELRDGTRHSVKTAPEAVAGAVKRIGASVGRIRTARVRPHPRGGKM